MNTNLVAYYKNRAEEYEKIYSKKERQNDLATATKILQNIFTGKNVLEIACGTGYWTERIAKNAASVFATDINETVINVAKKKNISTERVSFEVADMYSLPKQNKYDCLFGGFIWSHINLQDIDKFLLTMNSLVSPGGTVVFIDNNFVEGSSQPISNTDEKGNTFQTRQLEDGTTHLVLKNFTTEKILRQLLKNIANNIRVTNLEYFWILCYTTPIE